MTDKHTPGPWYTCGWNNMTVNAKTDTAQDGFCTIVGMPGGTFAATKDELQANARLIAAAPELLGTLECATACLESTLKVLTGGAKEMIEMQIAQGHAAIAKARGQQ